MKRIRPFSSPVCPSSHWGKLAGYTALLVAAPALLAGYPAMPLQAATTHHKKAATAHHSTQTAAKTSARESKAHSTHMYKSKTAAEPSVMSDRSVREAQAAVNAAHAQHEVMEQEKARQAAAVAQSRSQNEAAQAAAAEAKNRALSLSAATVSATSQLQSTEQQIADLQDQISDVKKEQASLQVALVQDAHALAPILPLAERLSLYPSDTLLAAPMPQGDAITGFLVLRGLSRQMEQEAEGMRARQARLAALNTTLTNKLAELNQLEQTQSHQRDTVRQQAALAREAQKQASATAISTTHQLQAATQRAASLQDAVSKLDALQAQAESALQKEIAAAERAHEAARAEAARRKMAAMVKTQGPGLAEHPSAGSGLRPVAGTLISTWGSATESGPATGMTYRTPPGASVRAPCAGTVDFAAPFRTYGQMLILNCGRHYRFIMAGLSGLAVDMGQSLTKGAPIGQMGSSGGSGTLFIQLRHGQKTINPAPFL
ncbi:murein hydrolase activator EnvC family protein [Acetobacter pasteurianus]|uniref:murein hydrolase activator EnvC family protein n=1 Tax=Acetobacter pasteurianus TaxID=438 RepID=UPI000384330E|nr:peptidoglycan DD-metalloendopeptidase family protein [Acetobacter pasteurianus]CCT60531.1 peptidase M23 [Acetobacter pasteurianus 386B]